MKLEPVVSAIVLGILVSGAASASDGVREINQTLALAGGVDGSLVDDPAGFPVRISRSGSYRLTGDLSVDQNTTAILITAPDVTIDLAGFTITGPNQCTFSAGPPPSLACAFATGGDGISSSAAHVVVVNGRIRGMGGTGIELAGNGGRVEGVDVSHCGEGGISSQAVVRASSIEDNGVSGVSANVVESSTIHRNGFHGVGASVIVDSVISNNVGNGISAVTPAVSRCRVFGNGGHGILASRGTLVGNQVDGNRSCGIQINNGGAVADNTVTGNNLAGSCGGFAGQTQVSGNALATGCNVVTCTSTGGLGTLCPGNVLSCF